MSGVRFLLGPDRELVELGLKSRTDLLGRADLPGVAQILIAGDARVPIQDADRNRVLPRGDLSRAIEVRRVVLDLIAIGARQIATRFEGVFHPF